MPPRRAPRRWRSTPACTWPTGYDRCLPVGRERRLGQDRLPCDLLSDVPVSEPAVEVVARHRSAEMEPLRGRAAERSECGIRFDVLNAFGDGVQAKSVSELYAGADDDRVLRVRHHVRDK